MAWGLLHAAVPPLGLFTTPAADIHTCSTYEVCTLLIADLKVLEFFALYCFFYPLGCELTDGSEFFKKVKSKES